MPVLKLTYVSIRGSIDRGAALDLPEYFSFGTRKVNDDVHTNGSHIIKDNY